MKCCQDCQENGWIWLFVLQVFLPPDVECMLNVTNHGQEEWCDPFLGKELVTLLQIWLPPIFVMKMSKATFADCPVSPASPFWTISFWKEQQKLCKDLTFTDNHLQVWQLSSLSPLSLEAPLSGAYKSLSLPLLSQWVMARTRIKRIRNRVNHFVSQFWRE